MVRGIVLDCFTAEEAVLADPAPKAFIDSIVDGRIHFNCFAHVESPRAAYGTRSAVLFACWERSGARESRSAPCRRRWSWCAMAGRQRPPPPPKMKPG